MCLAAICKFCWVECIFISFAQFSIRLFHFLLLRFELYVLDISTLLAMWFVNIILIYDIFLVKFYVFRSNFRVLKMPIYVQLPEYHLLKMVSKIILPFCQTSVGHIYTGLFLSSLFCSIDPCVSLSLPVPPVLDYYSCLTSLEIGYTDSSLYIIF